MGGSEMDTLFDKIIEIVVRDTELDVSRYRKLTLNTNEQGE